MCLLFYIQSDGEKSDQDLVVDDASEEPVSPGPHNGTASPRENGHGGPGSAQHLDKLPPKKEHASLGPHSPR